MDSSIPDQEYHLPTETEDEIKEILESAVPYEGEDVLDLWDV